ncbi:MAG: prepilin-type N-terminal cleavage/methylation domain-containing protein [bacterium]|nr:prepilin-type N-terminal cleavage/methylation domain-containing protein [bacterium]
MEHKTCSIKCETRRLKQASCFRFYALGSRGFSLLEMMISTGIFSVVILTAVGAMLSLNQAQIKAQNVQNIQDNIRFTLEAMTKELRTGMNYNPVSCGVHGCTEIDFNRQEGTLVGYCLDSGVIKRFVSPVICASGSPVTSSAVVIDTLYFYVTGRIPGPADGQPRITVTIAAHSVNPTLRLNTALNIETTVTARLRDL